MSDHSTSLRRLKIKSSDPLGLPLFLDPKDLTEKNTRVRRERRIIRSQQRQDAFHRNPEKYTAWQHRLEKFYKRAIWGAPPPQGSQRNNISSPSSSLSSSYNGHKAKIARQKNLSLFSAEALDRPVQLPSRTLWHYYYYNGKTRGERRALTLKRIEHMRQRHRESLEERRRAHRARIKRFAKVALERKERALTKDATGLAPMDAIEEASAKSEAARRIQQFYRGKFPPVTHCEACLTTASIGSADAAVQTDEFVQELVTIDQYFDADEQQQVQEGMLGQSYPHEEESNGIAYGESGFQGEHGVGGLYNENAYNSNQPLVDFNKEVPEPCVDDHDTHCVHQLLNEIIDSIEQQGLYVEEYADVNDGHAAGESVYAQPAENTWRGLRYEMQGEEEHYAQAVEMVVVDMLNNIEWALYEVRYPNA